MIYIYVCIYIYRVHVGERLLGLWDQCVDYGRAERAASLLLEQRTFVSARRTARMPPPHFISVMRRNHIENSEKKQNRNKTKKKNKTEMVPVGTEQFSFCSGFAVELIIPSFVLPFALVSLRGLFIALTLFWINRNREYRFVLTTLQIACCVYFKEFWDSIPVNGRCHINEISPRYGLFYYCYYCCWGFYW